MAKRLSKTRMKNEATAPPAPQSADGGSPDEKEIERLAHQYWIERGCPIGTPEEDWFRAAEEIKRRVQAAAATSTGV